MGKLLFWLIVGLVGLLTARLLAQQAANKSEKKSAKSAQTPPASPARRSQASGNQTSESLVRCAHCGIHLPRSQAYLLHGQIWCCEDHAHAAAG